MTGAKPPCSDEKVQAATGRTWAEWTNLLDKAGGREMAHPELANLLISKGIEPWWSQMVTVGYERLTGRRAVNEADEGFRVGAQRTVAGTTLRGAWTAVLGLAKTWMECDAIAEGDEFETSEGAIGEVRTVRRDQMLRVWWQEPGWPSMSRIEVTFEAKDAGCVVRIEHERLPTAEAKEAFRAFWKDQLAALHPAPR